MSDYSLWVLIPLHCSWFYDVIWYDILTSLLKELLGRLNTELSIDTIDGWPAPTLSAPSVFCVVYVSVAPFPFVRDRHTGEQIS